MTLESSITNGILRYLRTCPRTKAVKRHGSGMGSNGQPDIVGCINGLHFELEVKQVGNKPTKLQEIEMQGWRDAGALVAVVHSVDEVRKFLQPYGAV